MMRRVLAAFFAALVLGGFGLGLGATPASADGERSDIAPWRIEQSEYVTITGSNWAPNHPIRLYVSSPAREALREIDNDGLMTGHDGSIWFKITPIGFMPGHVTNGVWQLRICANVCHDLNMFVGGSIGAIPTGVPGRMCHPFVTPHANFPTWGPPGYAIDPRSGFTFNDIVAYCGPYATPWQTTGQFFVPLDWYPGYTLPYAWPYQTVFPWDPASSLFNCIYMLVNNCNYPGYSGPALPIGNGQPSGYGQIMP